MLDESLSTVQAKSLRDAGHDAVAVVEERLSGASDEVVRQHAIDTDRILITLDADFANILRFPPGGTPGVIRLKVHPPTEEAIRARIFYALGALKEVELRDKLAVVDASLIRIRS